MSAVNQPASAGKPGAADKPVAASQTSAAVSEPALLELKRVTVMRGERAALDDVTLRIAAGEHVCILGPNGCGKSTLIKTITRECYPLANEASSMSTLGKERCNTLC